MLRFGLAFFTLVSTLLPQDIATDTAVALARTALAKHLQADVSAATVSSVREVDWPNSSLGCPVAGEMYAQVITPGHLVRLRLSEKEYDVHVGGGRAVLCETPAGSPPAARPTPGANQAASEAELGLKMAQQARDTLASRLGLAADRVTIVSSRATTWPNAALGCTDQAGRFPPNPTRGFLIQLEAQSRRYEFHSDLARAIECAAKP